MKKILIHLIAFLTLPSSVNAGIPFEKNTWIQMDGGFRNYQINTADVKATNSKIVVGIDRRMTPSEVTDGYTKLNWNGKVTVHCKSFKYTISAKMGGGLLPVSRTNKITIGDLGYILADNLCFLTDVYGYTKNESLSIWAFETIKTIEGKSKNKFIQQGSSAINCDSPVWKNKSRCN